MLLHQFDEIEAKGRPWEACTGVRCYCQGAYIPGRLSAMIIYHGMRDRGDRIAIPLPFGDRAGLVLSPSSELECLYGVDGSTVFQRHGLCYLKLWPLHDSSRTGLFSPL